MKEDWLDSILNDLDSLPKATPREDFVQQLMDKASIPSPYKQRVKLRTAWLAAASIALIISANVLLMQKGSEAQNNKAANNTIAEEYGLSSDNDPYTLNYNE